MLHFLKGIFDVFGTPVALPAATTVDISSLPDNPNFAHPYQLENLSFIAVQLEVVGASGGAAGVVSVEIGKSMLEGRLDTQPEDIPLEITLNGTTTERKTFILDVRGSPALLLMNGINADAAVAATLQIRIYADTRLTNVA